MPDTNKIDSDIIHNKFGSQIIFVNIKQGQIPIFKNTL